MGAQSNPKNFEKRKIESFRFTIATLQISCNLID